MNFADGFRASFLRYHQALQFCPRKTLFGLLTFNKDYGQAMLIYQVMEECDAMWSSKSTKV